MCALAQGDDHVGSSPLEHDVCMAGVASTCQIFMWLLGIGCTLPMENHKGHFLYTATQPQHLLSLIFKHDDAFQTWLFMANNFSCK
jgi:hypothetical protein